MFRIVKKVLLTLLFLLVASVTYGQCAMCRATLENNLSNGDLGPAANINLGILYLFVFPYLLVGTIGYLWYKKSKAAQAKI